MPETQDIHTTVKELGELTRQFMTKNDDRETASKARQKEIDEVLKKINDRMDMIETKQNRPGLPASGTKEFDDMQSKAFNAFCRKGVNRLSPEELKAMSSDSMEDGGVLVTPNVASRIIEKLVEFSPIRQDAAKESISTGDQLDIPAEGDTVFEGDNTQGERESPSDTDTGTLGMKSIPTHIQYAQPKVTQKLLDDTAFNVEAWIARKLGEQFGKKEGYWFVNGTGVGQPQGILNASNGVTIVDATASGASATFDVDDMISLMADLPEYYAARAVFYMKRATKFAIRKLKNGNGEYLWQPSLQIGTPPTFDGHLVKEAIDMPAIGASNKAVVFGDLGMAYQIVDRAGITTLRDPFTAKPFVRFYSTRRVGGGVVLAEAMRILRCSA